MLGKFKVLALMSVVLGLAACSKQGAVPPPETKPVFSILAGSELKDVAPLVVAFGASKGVDVRMEYTGSLDAVDRLSEAHAFDATWLSHGKYVQLLPAIKAQVKSSEKTMYSRVVLGVKPEKMRELGWKSGKTAWTDVIAASKAGKFKFAMTNPSGSNTGFVALVGLATELSGKGDALEEKDIPAGKLKDLFIGQSMTSGSSGTLADQFVAAPDKADGMVNYESVIRTVAQRVPLEVLIPKEGVITADYPLMLMARSSQAAFYDQLVQYLRSAETQQRIAATTFRTPLTGGGDDAVVNELPFPGNLKVVDAILEGYMDSYSRPSSAYFVLDVSGSMGGQRMIEMKTAMSALTRGDGSVSGRFATFRQREHVELTPFDDQVYPSGSFKLTGDFGENKKILENMGQFVQGLKPLRGTAIYSALQEVYVKALAEMRTTDRMVSIVLFTDGENRSGLVFEDFQAFLQEQKGPRVPVFTIVYGEGNEPELKKLAAATGGKSFDARMVSLPSVMKSIRAYQ